MPDEMERPKRDQRPDDEIPAESEPQHQDSEQRASPTDDRTDYSRDGVEHRDRDAERGEVF